MVKVVPPSDWVDEENESRPSSNPQPTVASESHDSGLGSNFEDVDGLLANLDPTNVAKAQAQPARKRTSNASSSPSQQVAEDNPSNADSVGSKDGSAAEPVLPTGDWISDASKSRRKLVAGIAGAIALVVVAVTMIGYMVIKMGSSGGSEVASNDQTEQESDRPGNPSDDQSVDSNDDESSDENSNDDNDSNDQNEAETNNQQDQNELDTNEQTDPDNQTPINVADNNQAENTDPGPEDGNSNTEDSNRPPGFVIETPDSDQRRPVGSPILSDLDEFDNLLSDSGPGDSAESAVREAVERQRRANSTWLFSLKVPYVPKPLPEDIDFERRLGLSIEHIEQNQIPLRSFLNLMSQLSGIPIALSADAVRQPDIGGSTLIDVLIVEQSIDEALGETLGKIGLEVERGTHSIRVVPTRVVEELDEHAFPVEDLLVGFDGDSEALMTLVESFVMKDAQPDDDLESRLRVTDNILYIEQFPDQRDATVRFLNALREARGLPVEDEGERADNLLSPSQIARSCLDEPLTIEIFNPSSIDAITTKLSDTARIEVIVNWESLGELGWNYSTRLPLVVESENVEHALRMLAGSLGARYRVVGPRQFEILSEQHYYQKPEIAFYDCGPLLDANVSIEELGTLIWRVFPYAAESPEDFRFYFDGASRYMIAELVQDEQRALERMVQAWTSLAGRNYP